MSLKPMNIFKTIALTIALSVCVFGQPLSSWAAAPQPDVMAIQNVVSHDVGKISDANELFDIFLKHAALSIDDAVREHFGGRTWNNTNNSNTNDYGANSDSTDALIKKIISEARDENSNTVSHYAAQNPDPEAIIKALEYGVAPNAFNRDGNTAIHIAALYNNLKSSRKF